MCFRSCLGFDSVLIQGGRQLGDGIPYQRGEADAVDRELAQRFQSTYVHRLIVVITGIPDPDSIEGSNAIGLGVASK
jgi:RND superfamily putative drug exporter